MKAWPAALLAHLRGEQRTTALLWAIEKRDGTFIRGTEHDRAITIPDIADANGAEGTYSAMAQITASQLRQTSDLSVDNLEVQGAMPSSPLSRVDVNREDLEAGLLRNAPFQLWLCNWADPSMGAGLVKRGYLGDIQRDTDGAYTTEARGLLQTLQQTIGRTYSVDCAVRQFGDEECKVDVAALTVTGTVTSVATRRRFNATLTGGRDAGYFRLGTLTFQTGDNAGYAREVKRDDEDDVAGHISVWDQFPAAVEVGDTFTLAPDCDRLLTTCRDKYANLLNFRGYGIFVEGIDAMMKGPTG